MIAERNEERKAYRVSFTTDNGDVSQANVIIADDEQSAIGFVKEQKSARYGVENVRVYGATILTERELESMLERGMPVTEVPKKEEQTGENLAEGEKVVAILNKDTKHLVKRGDILREGDHMVEVVTVCDEGRNVTYTLKIMTGDPFYVGRLIYGAWASHYYGSEIVRRVELELVESAWQIAREEIKHGMEAERSAWMRGVYTYADELLEEFEDRNWYKDVTLAELTASADLDKKFRNGARSWKDYSWGGCSLIYDADIAERLCTKTELKMTANGEKKLNAREEWLDVQTRALFQASRIVCEALFDAVKKVRA